jgi:hypothetical protein
MSIVGRVILTPTEKNIDDLIRFYNSRSSHLVIAYNED